MTLYDEAGLSRNATAGEIRHAYHNIVRLLHPDSLQDPKLQTVAEAQLRRINAVFEVLNDPKRRADYDRTLEMGRPSNIVVTRAPVRWTGSSLIKPAVTGLAIVGLMFWVMQKPERVPVHREAREGTMEAPDPGVIANPSIAVPSAAENDVAEEIRKLRRELREVRGALPPAREATREDQIQPPEPRDVGSVVLAEPASTAAAMRANVPAITAPASPGSPAGVVGTWLYAQRRNEVAKKDWYPPDFIELRVQPSSRVGEGVVAGRFQARYRVGDRLISPEVRFRFEGKGDVFPWSGPNGARGEVRLTQVTPLTLQVDWTTTHPGDVPSLTSGSSLLVKSPE